MLGNVLIATGLILLGMKKMVTQRLQKVRVKK